jgi:hypothetical protein
MVKLKIIGIFVSGFHFRWHFVLTGQKYWTLPSSPYLWYQVDVSHLQMNEVKTTALSLVNICFPFWTHYAAFCKPSCVVPDLQFCGTRASGVPMTRFELNIYVKFVCRWLSDWLMPITGLLSTLHKHVRMQAVTDKCSNNWLTVGWTIGGSGLCHWSSLTVTVRYSYLYNRNGLIAVSFIYNCSASL